MTEITEAEALSVNLTYNQCLSYLRDNLYFYLGTREQRGLELFLNHAQQLGLAPEESRLMWDDCKAS